MQFQEHSAQSIEAESHIKFTSYQDNISLILAPLGKSTMSILQLLVHVYANAC